MIRALLGICYFGFMGYLVYLAGKRSESPPEQEEETDKSYIELSKSIDKLSERKKAIDIMNDMIADVYECSPGKIHKSVYVRIPENNHDYNFSIHGEDELSDLLIGMFEHERENQSTSLRSEISKI